MNVLLHLETLLRQAEVAEAACIEEGRKAKDRAAVARSEQATIRDAINKLKAVSQ